MNTVTVGGHRRPEVLTETLDALAHCHGIDRWRVLVVLDRPDVQTQMAARRWASAVLDLRNEDAPPYARISAATLHAFALGFATSDFVVHLEEDCPPAPDFLEFMAAMAERHRHTPGVSAVSAWWPAPASWGTKPPTSAWYATEVDMIPADGIASWGIGTWFTRWPDIRAHWDPRHWDFSLARGLVVHPLVSRVRNIGREGTQPVEEHDWRNRTQSPAFLPDAPSGAWSQM